MPRITRKKLKFTEDSVNELMQECYNETFNIRETVIVMTNRWKTAVQENKIQDIAAIGKEIINLIVQQDKLLGRKLEILKLLKDIVFVTNKAKEGKNGNDENDLLTPEEQDSILERIAKLKDNMEKK